MPDRPEYPESQESEAPSGALDFDFDLPDDISQQVEPATPETYDRREVQDHTGLAMLAVQRNTRKVDVDVLGNHARLICKYCNCDRHRVLCSAEDNHIQIVCGNQKCGRVWPALEVTPPQMNDRIARNTGLWVPDRSPRRN